jgi:hypothetical protein
MGWDQSQFLNFGYLASNNVVIRHPVENLREQIRRFISGMYTRLFLSR